MPWSKVARGASLKKSPLRHAEFVNSVVDLVNVPRRPKGRFTTNKLGDLVLQVKNDTGADRDQGEVIAFDEDALDEMDFDQSRFLGKAIDKDTINKHFGIYLKATPAGDYGPCQVSGICRAKLDVDDFTKVRTHCLPVVGEYVMDAHVAGPCEILSDITENGAAQDVWVRLGVSMGPVVLVLNGSLAAGGSATAKFYTADEGTETDSALTSTVYDYRESGDSYALDDRGIGVWLCNAWYFIGGGGGGGCRLFECTLDNDLASGDSTIGVTVSSALDGGALPDPVTVTANNTLSLSGEFLYPAVIVEDESADPAEYLLLNVKHIVVEVMVDVEYSTAEHAFRKKLRDITVMYEGDAGAWQNIVSLTDIPYVSDVVLSGLDIRKLRLSQWMIQQGATSENEVVVSGTTCPEPTPAPLVADPQQAATHPEPVYSTAAYHH
jgi:hypothetical protein